MLDRLYVITIEVLVSLALAAMVGIGFVSTVLRWVPGSGGLYWSEEIIRYACIWMVFLCSGLTIRYGIHFRVDLLLNRLPKRAAIGLSLFAVARIGISEASRGIFPFFLALCLALLLVALFPPLTTLLPRALLG